MMKYRGFSSLYAYCAHRSHGTSIKGHEKKYTDVLHYHLILIT